MDKDRSVKESKVKIKRNSICKIIVLMFVFIVKLV